MMRIITLIILLTSLTSNLFSQRDGSFSDLTLAYSSPLEVKELNLSNVSNEDIKNIGILKNLQILRIHFSQKIIIPKSIKKLKNLKTIQLSRNGITYIPKEIGELENLEQLILDRNQISELPKEIGELKKLNYLNLSGNKLKSFPQEISKLINLTHLGLSSNSKFNFVEGFQFISKLPIKSLGLSACGQHHLPKTISSFNELENIELTHNDFSMDFELVFNQLSDLPKLSKLNVSRNPELRTLPQSITKLAALEELNLHNNFNLNLEKEVTKLSTLKKLRIIDLGSLGIEKLPRDFGSLSNLEEISFWGNDKLDFQSSFIILSKIKSLKKLILSDCKLKELPKSTSQLENLVILDLSENPSLNIESIYPAVKRLTNLKTIDLTCMFSSCDFNEKTLEEIREKLNGLEIEYSNWGLGN